MMLLSCDSKYNPNLILQHGSTTYDYNFLGQLISADYANATISDESYSYDENGNRIVANGSTYTTSTNNELTSDGAYTYTYDDEGNRISKTNSTNTERELYTWDYRNRLTSVTKQTYNAETGTWENVQIVEYTYDYNNVWIRKVVGNDKTIFIPENYQTVAQIDNGAISHHYLWTPNTQDKLPADTTSSEILWSLTDHLGTIRDVVGNSTTHLIYDAFGNLTSGINPLLFAYTGKAFDTSTSLQNNINRWYDPTTGRWLSTDPIGFNGNDGNLYRYVHNKPANAVDFNGFIEKIVIEPTAWSNGSAQMEIKHDKNDCGYITFTVDDVQKWSVKYNNKKSTSYTFDYGWLRKDFGYIEVTIGSKNGKEQKYRKTYKSQTYNFITYDAKFTYILAENAGVSLSLLSVGGYYKRIWSADPDAIFEWFPVAAQWTQPLTIYAVLLSNREAGLGQLVISHPKTQSYGEQEIVGAKGKIRNTPAISGTGPKSNIQNFTNSISLQYQNNNGQWFVPADTPMYLKDKLEFAISPFVTSSVGIGLGITRNVTCELPGHIRTT